MAPNNFTTLLHKELTGQLTASEARTLADLRRKGLASKEASQISRSWELTKQ